MGRPIGKPVLVSQDRPRVGVTGSQDRGRMMWWFNRFALWRAGAKAVRLQARQTVDLASLDAFVLGGGDDIDASLYGMDIKALIRIDRERDNMELNILSLATRLGRPVLGICRGAQMINVYFGGSLHEDVHDAYTGAPRMRTPLPRKTIFLDPSSRIGALVNKPADRVNALHHQSVKRLGRGVKVAARDEHGIVQAIECPAFPFLLGVQWHPEFMVFDSGQQRLYKALVTAARNAAKRPPAMRRAVFTVARTDNRRSST